MKNISKRSEGSVTSSKSNSFYTARLKLSLLYTAVFGTLVLILSGIFYYLFAADIHEDMSAVFPDESEQTRIINQHKGKLRNLMIVIDGGILLFISASSYYLAGKTLRPVEENYEAQKRFVADASHDLRTPIAILKADMEVYIEDKKMPVFFREILSGYLEEVDQMKYIVENLLTLFRFDSNQMQLLEEKIDMQKLVTENTSTMLSYAGSKKIKLKLISKSRIFVNGDSHLLRQAFRNILKNAIEYSDEKGTVNIILNRKNNSAELSVQNKGAIISREEIAYVFDRFYRTDKSRTKRKEGTGLGLPVTKHIVEKHGGIINITSNQKEGTVVTVSLPLNKN